MKKTGIAIITGSGGLVGVESVNFFSQFFDKIIHLRYNYNKSINDLQNKIGKFNYGPLIIDIKAKNNLMNDYKKINNTDLLLNSQVFKFI